MFAALGCMLLPISSPNPISGHHGINGDNFKTRHANCYCISISLTEIAQRGRDPGMAAGE